MLVLCSVMVEGVMRGIAVLENHADRNACIDKADRGETSRDECVFVCLYWKKYVCREVCVEWIQNVGFVCVCVFTQRKYA